MNVPLIRLLNQQIILPQYARPEDVVGWMGAVQAQDWRSALWAVGTDVLPAEWAHKAHNNRGIFQRITLQNGQVVGNWNEHTAAEGVRVSTTHWRNEIPTDPQAIEKATDRFIRYMSPHARSSAVGEL